MLDRSHLAIAVGLLVLALILGGGGSPNPSTELLLGLLAGIAAIAWLWLPSRRKPSSRTLWLLTLLVVIIPLLQLVPLPPSIWTALPGREAEAAALALVGAQESWRPLSTSPMLTLSSLLALAPPLILLWMTASLTARERTWLLCAVAGMAILSALLGVLQLAGGHSAPKLYEASHPLVVIGFQANRNATADVLLIGITALAAFSAIIMMKGSDASQRRNRNFWLSVGGAVLLLLACIFTASRAGIALTLPVVIAGWGIIALAPGKIRGRRIAAIAAGFITLVLTSLFVLLQQNSALQKVADRFGFVDEGRQNIWADTLSAIGEYWPLGSGIGTFVPTFIALEPLESVDPSSPNRAHNDYLEFALEAGIPGLVVLALVILLLLFMAVRAWKSRPDERPYIAFGMIALVVIAAHSIVDYPLRSMSLACLAAIAAGMLIPANLVAKSTPAAGREKSGKDRNIGLSILLSVFLVFYLVSVFGRGMDRMTLSSPGLERLVPGPFRAEADRMAGSVALAQSNADAALSHAITAVRADPGSALGLSLLGSAHFLKGQEQQADDAFRVAAQRGWRDLLTQLYWFDVALSLGDYRLAALRADAIARTGAIDNEAALILEMLEASEPGRAALAERLGEQPQWASNYFTVDGETNLPTLQNRIAVVMAAGKIRKQGCDAISGLTTTLLTKGMRHEAVELWRINCDPAVTGDLSDGSFDQMANEGKRSPFGWRRHPSGDVSVNVVDDGENGSMILTRNSSNIRKLALSQAIQIAPGSYRIKAAIRSSGADRPGQVTASLDCEGSARRPTRVTGDLASGGQLITISQCPRPILGLWLSPGIQEVSIDNVTIEPAGRP